MNPIFRGLSVSLFALTAAACTTPNPQPLSRDGDVPPAFTAPIADQSPVWPETNWWINFHADELPALEETAQRENLDLAAAAARVIQSEANAGVAFSALLPTVNLQGGATRTGTRPSTPGGSTTSNLLTGGLAASYEIDFWGLSQDKLRQARETLRASRYAATVIGLTTSSNVAVQYFTVLAARERITIARQNIEAAKRIMTVTQAKVSNGVSSNLDLAEQQATVAQQEARLPLLIEQEREARYALAILLGRAPEGFDVNAQNLNGVMSPAVQPGLPSAVLERRPDVAQAEAQLFAAHANLDAARAAFFPHLGLTGSGSYASAAVGSLINPANLAWSVGATLLQSVFDGGRLSSQDDLAKAQQTELIANYRKVVFSAFSDVETSLGQTRAYNDQIISLAEQVRASTEAFRISELQYREGTIDILSLLQAQQSLFTAEDSLVQAKLSRLSANVSLYRALGGGWTQTGADEAYQPQLDCWPL